MIIIIWPIKLYDIDLVNKYYYLHESVHAFVHAIECQKFSVYFDVTHWQFHHSALTLDWTGPSASSSDFHAFQGSCSFLVDYIVATQPSFGRACSPPAPWATPVPAFAFNLAYFEHEFFLRVFRWCHPTLLIYLWSQILLPLFWWYLAVN